MSVLGTERAAKGTYTLTSLMQVVMLTAKGLALLVRTGFVPNW